MPIKGSLHRIAGLGKVRRMAQIKVGKVKDAHGIRGELFVVSFAGEAAWLPQLKTLHLVNEQTGASQDFAVKSARVHKNGFIVKSNDIQDRNHAETLRGLILEIPEEFMVSKPGEAIYLREILGFEVTDGDSAIGRIEKFSSNGAQDLLVVSTSRGEFEIPFVEAFVEKINYDSKKIRMRLPAGLLGDDADAANEPDDGRAEDESDESLATESEDKGPRE